MISEYYFIRLFVGTRHRGLEAKFLFFNNHPNIGVVSFGFAWGGADDP
ncbi:MAG: hypothetical protein JJU02_15880 [Cryomorphaceae bacterium]|nr:hypothetical protein [Cryomorphaceae bacterium]